MAEQETTGDGWSIRTPGLRLEFRWRHDRWTHWLEVGSDARCETVARSLEGDPDRDDSRRVVSPTYQQIEFQRGVDRLGALLLGQCGPHHFSAVFAVWEGPSEVGVEVDVADRCRLPVESLACTYAMALPPSDLRDTDPARVIWQPYCGSGGLLRFEGAGPTRVAVDEAQARATRVQALTAIDPSSHTHRCVYRWLWTRPEPGSP